MTRQGKGPSGIAGFDPGSVTLGQSPHPLLGYQGGKREREGGGGGGE